MQMIFHRKAKGKKGSASNTSEESSSLSKRSSKQNSEPLRPVFNVLLNVALENNPSLDGIPVVALVRNCIDYVTDHGLTVEGIYRISASKNVLDEQERLINCGEIVEFNDPHEAANLLKRFLRGLPEHILTNNYAREIEQIAGNCTCNSTSPCRCETAGLLAEFLSKKLPAPNHYLLGYVFLHAQHVVLNSDMNKMNLSALGVLLQAILKLSKNEVRIFLLNASSLLLKEGEDEPITELFTGIEFERYNQPSGADKNGYPPILNDDNAVRNEISRQEKLLADINEQLKYISDKKSPEAKDKDRQIQRIQQTIISLKRRIETKTNHEISPLSSSSNTVTHEETKQSIQVGSLPPVFVEKQLLAVHISLKDDINEEKKKVAQHLTRLRNIQNELPPDLLESFEKLPVQQPSPQPSNNTEADAEKLDAKKEELLNEIMYYKDLNARLRARYEQCNTLLNTLKQAKNNKELTSECLSVIAPTSSTNQLEAETQNKNSLLVTRF